MSDIIDAPVPMDTASRQARAAEQGFDRPLFHGTKSQFDSFAPNSHFGSHAQASMRNPSSVIPVLVRGKKFKRVKDTGRNAWDATMLRKLARQGFDGIVYLNRYEGIPAKQFEALRAAGIDDERLSDAAFKKRVPAAEDSYIVFDPKNVRASDACFHPARQFSTGMRD